MITATNEDNMLMMARYPDDYFDLAIVDPPYGVNVQKQSKFGNNKDIKEWDNKPPIKEYFTEIKRVSKNQIIWGGNYFLDNLGNTRCFLIWDKQNGSNDMADAELAWSSFKTSVRMYRGHIFKGIGCTNYKSIHPTQKPVKLYEWILMNYAKEGDKIVDTHRGSASLDIACHNLGFDLVTCELDKDYFNDGNKRLKQHQNQQVMKF
jgi:site-specific DNA-methyltransferase (adenine-specific)